MHSLEHYGWEVYESLVDDTEHQALEIAITKLLLKSYYDIVRKNIEDSVPKAIMHFLVNGLIQAMKNLLICLFFSQQAHVFY